MKDNFTRIGFDKKFNVSKIITIFYMEISKNFKYDGERHDFWEMVYIDKGEMICTADKNRFILKSGEMTFHKPNEFHNLSGDNRTAPNISIITFECKSSAMKFFEGKIFKLTPEEKAMLSLLFSEGLSCFRLIDEKNPLLQNPDHSPCRSYTDPHTWKAPHSRPALQCRYTLPWHDRSPRSWLSHIPGSSGQ